MKKEQDSVNNQDVSEALALLGITLKEEKTRIFNAGSKAMDAQDAETAWAVLDFAKKLEGFTGEVQKLIAKWSELLKEREGASPAVQKIVTGEGRLFKPRKSTTGFSRKITHPLASKTNFTVRFPDGTIISDSKACNVLCKVIEKMGPAKVAALCALTENDPVRISGEPLVARKKGTKYFPAWKEVDGGYFVLTHSSTETKIALLRKVAKKLNLKLKIEQNKK